MTGEQDTTTPPSAQETAADSAQPTAIEHVHPEEHPDAAPWSSVASAAEAGWDGQDMPPSASGSDGGGQEPPSSPENTAASGAEPPAVGPTAAPPANPPEDVPESKPMTLMDHLGELRNRLIRICIAVAVAFMACYGVADILFKELRRPLVEALPPGSKLIFTALPEAFFVYLQVGVVAAIFLASPYIFYQIWAFVAPGLYEEEKKGMAPIAFCSAFFFLAGAAFCYFVVFPFAFTFFVGFATDDIAAMPSLSEYLSFALKLLIAFGLIFEMPLFTFFLARMGIVTAAMMRNVRRYAILAIFIIAAILTPPDVMSQLLMAFPMLLLYELSIWVAVAFGKKRKEDQEETAESPKQEAA